MEDQIVDPITGFEIPKDWINRLKDPNALDKIRSGKWILLSNGKMLRRGYTTGTTSAAACKGAIASLLLPAEETLTQVEIATPVGIRISVPIRASAGLCSAVKNGGDHQFDITNGIEFLAMAKASQDVKLIPGAGIGRIKSQGLCAPRDKAAISQSACHQIMNAIREGLKLAGLKGARVELCVPSGQEIASHTLNPQLGIEDGISILGSTGFVEPWNEHLSESRGGELRDFKKVLATTGRTGLKYSRILFPDHKAILIGSHLNKIEFREDQNSILCGLPALILKWACPQILEGTGYCTIAEMVEMEPDHPRISEALKRVRKKLPFTRIVLLKKDGKIFRDIGDKLRGQRIVASRDNL